MTEKIIGLINAAEIAEVHLTTIKFWCRRYNIGEKIGHQWHIDADKLQNVMSARAHLKLMGE